MMTPATAFTARVEATKQARYCARQRARGHCPRCGGACDRKDRRLCLGCREKSSRAYYLKTWAREQVGGSAANVRRR